MNERRSPARPRSIGSWVQIVLPGSASDPNLTRREISLLELATYVWKGRSRCLEKLMNTFTVTIKRSRFAILVLCFGLMLFSESQLSLGSKISYEPPSTALAPVPADFYRSLTEGISTVDGSLTIELNKTANRWKTTVGGTRDVEWKYGLSALPATARPVMEVNFKYENGFLQSSVIEFKPEIQVNLVPAISQAKVVSKIFFNADGHPSRYEGGPDTDSVIGSWDKVTGVNFAEHIRFAFLPAQLFSIGPFRWSSSPIEAGGTGPFLKKMVLNLSAAQEARGGLEVSLNDHAQVIFSKQAASNTFDNVVTAAKSSRFRFKTLSLDLGSGQLQGKLFGLDLTVYNGRINSEGLTLLLDEGARLFFKDMEFSDSAGGPSALKGDNGKLTGKVMLGSKVLLSSGTNETSLFADTGSIVSLDSLVLEITTQTSSITIGGDSKVDFQMAAGRLPLVGRDYVSIKSGRVLGEISSGTWRRNSAPVAVANLRQVDYEISSGVISLVSGRGINLRGGNLKGKDLAVNGAASPVVTGNFDEVTLDLEDGEVLEIPGRFVIVARSASRLIANDAANPFSIRPGFSTVSAGFRAVIPFWTCFMPPAGSPVIRDSMLRSTFILNGSGGIGGTDEVVDYTCCAR